MELGALIGILSGIITGLGGFIIAWATFRARQKKEDKEGGVSYGIIQTDIGHIKAGIDDLKKDNRESRVVMSQLSERVAKTEEATKSAHKRIDKLENRERSA